MNLQLVFSEIMCFSIVYLSSEWDGLEIVEAEFPTDIIFVL